MSSNLTAVQLLINLGWTEQNALAGFDTNTATNRLGASIIPTVDVTNARQIYFVQGSLAAGASLTLDLSSLTTPTFGAGISPTGAYILVLKGSGSTWSYDPFSSNQFYWFLDAVVGNKLVFNDGDVIAYGSTTPGTIDGTHKNIRITNTSGSDTLTYAFAIVLKTA